jgi:exodeoxyribonuclease V alpha subunit
MGLAGAQPMSRNAAAHTQQGPQDVLAGIVERVTYHNEENGFCVLRVKAHGQRDLVTVVGHAAAISAGEWITASGEWINDRTHGQQFKARFLKTTPPTTVEGIKKYLSSGMIRGTGPVYSSRMVKFLASRFSTSSRPVLSACARFPASAWCRPSGWLP